MNLRNPVLCLALLLGAAAAQAQMLKTPQWAAWVEAGKSEELERAAEARLRGQPDDAEALVARALAAIADGDVERVQAAGRGVQRCIDQQPKQAICYAAMATVQGVEIVTGGTMKAITLARPIRGNLQRALELDPLLFEPRQALLELYLKLPSFAGGGADKAQDLVQQARARQPEHAKLLAALLAHHDKQYAEMERGLQGVKPGNDPTLHMALREAWYELGMQYVFDGDFAHAKAIFENLERAYPRHATAAFGLARLAAAQQQYEESARQFERARGLIGAPRLPLDYRLGLMLIDKGDREQARVTLERFVARKRGAPKYLDDARKRLAELG
ncbi:tetratricopeptide repeat protein [Roseateles violae]|uniref:Tetratricopeptide repeat protein n=1 Tax=Roseateles violae TaxID=3058042 RepID=A0ABT8DPG6_9BURK|nr:hypothetical protein [Pelomonas sp. PFR6]MDN3920246.1 hypothetical protein [Pelomonas sp. PFR6]